MFFCFLGSYTQIQDYWEVLMGWSHTLIIDCWNKTLLIETMMAMFSISRFCHLTNGWSACFSLKEKNGSILGYTAFLQPDWNSLALPKMVGSRGGMIVPGFFTYQFTHFQQMSPPSWLNSWLKKNTLEPLFWIDYSNLTASYNGMMPSTGRFDCFKWLLFRWGLSSSELWNNVPTC